MINEEVKKNIESNVKGKILFDELLSNHSTIKIGGKADLYIEPDNIESMTLLMKTAKENHIPITIIGKGSNVLFRDSGYEGIIASTAGLKEYSIVQEKSDHIILYSEAGVSLSALIDFCVEKNVTGFEQLFGIPATVGGALATNAGTKKGSISDITEEITAIDKSGKTHVWPKEKISFSYRKTKLPRTSVIVSGKFQLLRDKDEKIKARIEDIKKKRKSRQPTHGASLGSIFKNPEKSASAGELIDDAGLKGVRVGGARISNEHANWIINEGDAKSKDVEVLMQLAKDKVKENSKITLEPEIIIIGKKDY